MLVQLRQSDHQLRTYAYEPEKLFKNCSFNNSGTEIFRKNQVQLQSKNGPAEGHGEVNFR
jgi:hypothetical protein